MQWNVGKPRGPLVSKGEWFVANYRRDGRSIPSRGHVSPSELDSTPCACCLSSNTCLCLIVDERRRRRQAEATHDLHGLWGGLSEVTEHMHALAHHDLSHRPKLGSSGGVRTLLSAQQILQVLCRFPGLFFLCCSLFLGLNRL